MFISGVREGIWTKKKDSEILRGDCNVVLKILSIAILKQLFAEVLKMHKPLYLEGRLGRVRG